MELSLVPETTVSVGVSPETNSKGGGTGEPIRAVRLSERGPGREACGTGVPKGEPKVVNFFEEIAFYKKRKN